MERLATFGAGCFWGVEEVFRKLEGVRATRVGYAGGTLENPSERDVATGTTGHAEVVRVTYDPDRIEYRALLSAFWRSHDPTEFNRQGTHIGTQYRSVIFYHDAEQAAQARASRARQQETLGNRPLATEICPAGAFYPAAEHHQQYLLKRGSRTAS